MRFRTTWIGIQFNDEAKKALWSEGFNIQYKNYAIGQEALLDSGKCVTLNASGEWEVHPCDEIYPYICEGGGYFYATLL